MASNYYGWNTPTVLTEKAQIEAALTELARAEGIYDNEGGWSPHNLEQLSHELHYAGFNATDTGALRAALVGYTNGVGSGAGAANYWKETEPDRR